MTKIANTPAYQIKENIVLTDYFPGTNSETEKLETVSFRFQDVQKYLLSGLTPETGGTMRITEISYAGEGYSTASELLNALDPNYVVMRYHVVIVSVNGAKSLFKLQDITVGLGQDEVTDADFILFPTAVGPVGNGIDSVVKTGTVGLVDTYTITFTNASTTTFNITNGANGADGSDGVDGNTGATGNGIASIVKTNTVGLVDTYTVTLTNSDTSTFEVTNGENGVDGNDGGVGPAGNGILSFAKTGTAGLEDTYTITFTDSSTNNIIVTNGANGAPGADYTSNLQKTITYPGDFTGINFNLTNAENNYSVEIDNGTTAVTITVPTGLMAKIQVGFIQKGTGLVTFVESGTVLKYLTGLGLKMTGVNANAYLEKSASTEILYLFGNIEA